MSRIAFLILYIIVVLLDLWQVYIGGDFRAFTKPLIMISLIGYFLTCFQKYSVAISKKVFLLALLSALAGDCFLLFDHLFVYGLCAFLMMQLLYSYSFYQDFKMSKSSTFYTMILIAIILGVAFVLWPSLGSLKVPVVVYMSAIALMSITAFGREKGTSGYWWIFIGTLLFIVSDTVLGIHQFDVGLNFGKLTVMSMYASAQYAIVQGIMDRGLTN